MITLKSAKKRIGLILASIHTGSSLNLWTSLAAEAERAGVAFFVFPGGRLDSRPDSEYLRNSTYRLANEENLDGLISWGSSIGGAVTLEELNRFHVSLEPLPYITIAHKMNGHPCVKFDAYTGMKALVTHFIKEHGDRKIAFIRGPARHLSAEDRFRAYSDALAESGITPGEAGPLVSDPFPWSEGEAAAAQLYESRHLVPGQDFDTLIGASDMMVFSAVRYLEKSGFGVPRDFRCGGFNNSAESRILTSPLSTVHMPYAELGLSAFKMIRTLLSGNRNGGTVTEIPDFILPAEVVLRESCGCKNNLKAVHASGSSGRNVSGARESQLLHRLSNLFRLDETDQNAVLHPVVSALREGNSRLFFNLFEKALVRFYDADRETRLLLQGMELVKRSGCFDPELLSRLEGPVLEAVARTQGRVLALKTYETGRRYGILNSLKCDLLCARDRTAMIHSLAAYLPETGIHTCSLVIYEDEEYSRYIGGFSPEGEDNSGSALFPSRHILPTHHLVHYGDGVFMVQPLFMENQSLGYIICNVPFFEGSVFEELRSAVSSALKGIFLFEEATAAKQKAEKAERAKTEFFANVGNDLCEPLTEIEEELVLLESRLRTSPGDGDLLSGQVASVRKRIGIQIDRTNRLIDLTLSQINELTFYKRLFHIDELFPGVLVPGAADFPLLSGDPDRLAQAVSLAAGICGGKIDFSVTEDGLLITFHSEHPLPEAVWTKNEALLTEKLFLLQYGSFTRDSTGCRVVLPWPNLAGLPPIKSNGSGTLILVLSENLPLSGFHLPLKNVFREETLSKFQDTDENLLLAWNPDSAVLADWIRVYALRHHPGLFRAPFLCYGKTFSGENLIKIIEKSVLEKKQGPILFIAGSPLGYKSWAPEENSLYISSMSDYERTIGEITPSMAVFGDIDVEAVKQVRLHPATVLVPVLILPERIRAEADVAELCSLPNVLLCNQGVADSQEFADRVHGLLSGQEILPPHTGALVKKAILYFNIHAPSQIARWKLADHVNVSEDYLTRIFHKETGLSPWEYLNHFRISLAAGFLLHSDDTINEISQRTGFQDQAYFCRVFKKMYGVPPGKFRTKS